MADPSTSAPRTSGPPGPDPLIGRTFNDRFKVLALIARGGMGKVYRAEQTPLGRLVALKVLNPNYAGDHDPEFHKRFFLEASICSKLTHPNTVTIFDYGKTDDDVYYIAMELLEGRTVYRALRESGPMSAERTVHIARQVCRSLREAHELGVIHRDLKPANVFLTTHGDEEDFVKVLDFGLVKNIEDRSEALTQEGLFMGSPKYMAPEQIQGGAVDARTDVYSLGVVMFEMLTGKVPFDRPSSMNILMAHVNDPVPPMKELAPSVDVPPALEAVVRACMAKSQDDRFSSMDELLAALRDAASGSGIVSRMSSEVPLGRTTSTSGAFPAAKASTPPAAAPEPERAAFTPGLGEARAEPKRGGRVALFVGLGVVVVAAIAIGAWMMGGNDDGASSSRPIAATPTTPVVPDTPVVPPPPAARVLVALRSSPPGATVTVAGHTYGPTPVEVEWNGDDARAGREVTFLFHHDGFADFTSVRTVSGGSLEVSAQLEPLHRPPVHQVVHAGHDEHDVPVGPVKGYKTDPY